jgi:hypothetical protein
MECRSCKKNNTSPILNLGHHPWCNDFLQKKDIGKESFYPLNLVYCNECELLQLDYTVPKETMFKNHTYVSSTTKTLKKHFLDLAIENKSQFNLKSDDLILDIGGNDGTQLLQYKSIGLENVLNVESADNIADISIKSGVKTINDFFNEEVVNKKIGPKTVSLINASGVFFHLEEIHSVIKGIVKCLKDNGVFVVQFMYAGTMVEKLNFDGIYHEHLCYYTLNSLKNLLKPYGLKIFDSYYSEIHSGSIIAKVCKETANFELTERHKKTIENDKKYNKINFLEFAKIIESKKNDLEELLTKIKKDNPKSKIYAYGAPAKGNTLLNYFNIDKNLIDKCVEVNDLKIGLFLPKSHIPIVKETVEDIPDYYLLLSHNFTDEIIKKNKPLIEKGVKFIIPFPKIQII